MLVKEAHLTRSGARFECLCVLLNSGRFYFQAPAQFVTFTFATGGAGFCLSQAAMQKIKFKVSRVYGGRGLEGLCLKMEGLADDVAVGYINGSLRRRVFSLNPVKNVWLKERLLDPRFSVVFTLDVSLKMQIETKSK